MESGCPVPADPLAGLAGEWVGERSSSSAQVWWGSWRLETGNNKKEILKIMLKKQWEKKEGQI